MADGERQRFGQAQCVLDAAGDRFINALVKGGIGHHNVGYLCQGFCRNLLAQLRDRFQRQVGAALQGGGYRQGDARRGQQPKRFFGVDPAPGARHGKDRGFVQQMAIADVFFLGLDRPERGRVGDVGSDSADSKHEAIP